MRGIDVPPSDKVVTALEDYGRDRYYAGFTEGIRVAWTMLRWMGAKNRPLLAEMQAWTAGEIREAYRRAGIDMPEAGKEP